MMEIRKCQEQDIAETGAFYDRVVRWLDAHTNYPKWIYKVYPSTRYVRETTEAEEQYICTEDDRIIGAFALNADPQGAYDRGAWKQDLPEGSYLIIHALAIEPDRQGNGAATEVLRFCVEKAKAAGYRAIRADIVPDNWPARRFCEKNGFTYAGEADLLRNLDGIPGFCLYELNW